MHDNLELTVPVGHCRLRAVGGTLVVDVLVPRDLVLLLAEDYRVGRETREGG